MEIKNTWKANVLGPVQSSKECTAEVEATSLKYLLWNNVFKQIRLFLTLCIFFSMLLLTSNDFPF